MSITVGRVPYGAPTTAEAPLPYGHYPQTPSEAASRTQSYYGGDGNLLRASYMEEDFTPEAPVRGPEACPGVTKAGALCGARQMPEAGFCAGHWKGVLRYSADVLNTLAGAA